MPIDHFPDGSAPEESTVTEAKAFRPKPTKALPTDRLSFEKQTLILRAIVKASLSVDRGAVSNNEVAQFADVAASSVSLCNAFFGDCGLTVREGNKIRPAEAAYEYDTAAQWEPDTAGHRLAPVLSNTWFAKAILTKLALRPTMPTSEALAFLAQQCNASLDYKAQLTLLLDYLNAAGLITMDGNSVSLDRRHNSFEVKANVARFGSATPSTPEKQPGAIPAPPSAPAPNMKRITIALPDKDSVVIEIPENFDGDDWILVADQLVGYIKRWKRFTATQALKEATQEDDAGNGTSGP